MHQYQTRTAFYFTAPLVLGAALVGGIGVWLRVTEPIRAAQRCGQAISEIAQAECEYALREGHYAVSFSSVEHYSPSPLKLRCPLDHRFYSRTRVVGLAHKTAAKTDLNPDLLISCPNAALHAKARGQLSDYQRFLVAPSTCGL